MAAAYMAGQEDAFGFVWPLDCTRVTDDMTAGESMKLQTSMTNHILQELKGTDHKAHEPSDKHSTDKYGGESTAYRRWERYLLSATAGAQLTELDIWVKHPDSANFTPDNWNLLYSRSDREFLYRVFKDQIVKHYMRRQSSYNAQKERQAAQRPQVHQAGPDEKQRTEKGDRGQPRPKRKIHCKHCKAWVMHKEENCWNNPKNKAMKPNAKLQKNIDNSHIFRLRPFFFAFRFERFSYFSV